MMNSLCSLCTVSTSARGNYRKRKTNQSSGNKGDYKKVENAAIIVGHFLEVTRNCFQLCNLRKKIGLKLKAQEEYQKEVCGDDETVYIRQDGFIVFSANISLVDFQNKVLKKQIAKEIAKSSQLEIVVC